MIIYIYIYIYCIYAWILIYEFQYIDFSDDMNFDTYCIYEFRYLEFSDMDLEILKYILTCSLGAKP
jgi:hypothetical protein